MKASHFASLWLLILLCIGRSHAQTGPELSQIQVQSNQFVTADGKCIIFRGLNTSDPDKPKKSGHWKKAHFEEMKR